MRHQLFAWLALPVALALSGCSITGGGRVNIEELRAKAEAGDPAAQFQLGQAYDNGGPAPRDLSQAASWYRKAAGQGYAAAQNSLGSMYQHGEGVPLDNAEAVQWYQKAADQGFVEAYTNLGYMYDFGLGVQQDKQKAFELYQQGAKKGSLNGMLDLGLCYWNGEGVAKDIIQAYWWLDNARFHTQFSPNMTLKWRIRGALDGVASEMTKEDMDAAVKLGAATPLRWKPAAPRTGP